MRKKPPARPRPTRSPLPPTKAAYKVVDDERGKENLQSLVPPIGHPQRAAALGFLHLPLTASDEDVRRRVAELLRVNDENVGLNAHGLPLAPGEQWEPDPVWHEYSSRFLDGGLRFAWDYNELLARVHRAAYGRRAGRFGDDRECIRQ